MFFHILPLLLHVMHVGLCARVDPVRAGEVRVQDEPAGVARRLVPIDAQDGVGQHTAAYAFRRKT